MFTSGLGRYDLPNFRNIAMLEDMERISSSNLGGSIGQVLDQVLRLGPVMVTRYGRDLVVILSAEEYKRLTSDEGDE